jgi:hypothetical protein
MLIEKDQWEYHFKVEGLVTWGEIVRHSGRFEVHECWSWINSPCGWSDRDKRPRDSILLGITGERYWSVL